MENLEGAQLCFPQLLNSSCRKPVHPQTGVMLLYCLSFISILTAALNLLVIISISHFRQLHTTTNFVLLSLAVSDFLVGLVVMPGEIILMETCWFLGDLMCAVYYLLALIIISASTASMVLISVDRYVAICYPLHYPTKFTLKRVRICVCLCWSCCLFVSVLLLYDHLKQPGRYNSCYGECVVNIAGDVDLVLSFIIPISIIITLYLRVFVVAVSQARSMRSHIAAVTLRSSQTVTAKRSELKAARTLGIVVAVFLLCYCPYYCVSLTGGEILIGSTTEAFIAFLVYFNSCLNPVIYAFFYSWFRKTVRIIVTLQVMQPGSCEANIL
ncbi:trace amine-associated receptor 13c-like [Dicentrarchus labrax]|uniref:G-protein coupled receptors family 1 profile domain-containing protein n=1 Tax=Dicentrarchus labrax TaxID=13489 RepID=A0A8C4GMH6_DICLA|nr:trace amine-associated receptor 13c-like [Dicentrarchus labrax]